MKEEVDDFAQVLHMNRWSDPHENRCKSKLNFQILKTQLFFPPSESHCRWARGEARVKYCRAHREVFHGAKRTYSNHLPRKFWTTQQIIIFFIILLVFAPKSRRVSNLRARKVSLLLNSLITSMRNCMSIRYCSAL